MLKPKPPTLKHISHISKANLSIFILIFASIGAYIIYSSLAAPNPNLLGDLNGDNKVDISDLSILANNYKTTNSSADINGDGIVDLGDLSILLAHYGQTYGGGGACVSSTTGWQNNSFSAQTATFTATFTATPSAANINADIGYSNGAAAAFTDLGAIVEFSSNGQIQARNGGAYASTNTVTYSGGTVYSFRVIVDITNHVYDVYVTPNGGTEVQLAARFAFRTEQASVSQLNNWAQIASTGSAQVCNMQVTAGGTVSGGGGSGGGGSGGAGTIGCAGPTCIGKLAVPDTSHGTKYYISTSGSTGNSGTSASSPWPFSKASGSTFKPGDSINFACGQSFGSLSVNSSGTSGNPVIYQTDGSCGQAAFAGIIITSRNWVTLYNLKSYVTGYLDSGYGVHGTFIALEVDAPSDHVTIQGSDFSTSGGVGSDDMAAGVPSSPNITNLIVDSSVFHGSGDTAMYLYGSNNTVQYSQFYGNGGHCPSGCATHSIYMKSEYSTFAFNDFGSISSGQSISIRRTHENIYGNLFHDGSVPLSYFAEETGGGTTNIYDNRFQVSGSSGYLFYVDDNQSDYTGTPTINVVWANNTIQGSSSDYLFPISHNAGTFKAYNNIAIGSWAGTFNSTTHVTQSNNLWFNATGVGAGPAFTLQSTSNAVNAGTTSVPGLTYSNSCNMQPLSYCGSTVDIGSVESSY